VVDFRSLGSTRRQKTVRGERYFLLFTPPYSLLSDKKPLSSRSSPTPSGARGRGARDLKFSWAVGSPSSTAPRDGVPDQRALRSLATLAGPLDYARGMARVARDDNGFLIVEQGTGSSE
jgi:hypothetical protein